MTRPRYSTCVLVRVSALLTDRSEVQLPCCNSKHLDILSKLAQTMVIHFLFYLFEYVAYNYRFRSILHWYHLGVVISSEACRGGGIYHVTKWLQDSWKPNQWALWICCTGLTRLFWQRRFTVQTIIALCCAAELPRECLLAGWGGLQQFGCVL